MWEPNEKTWQIHNSHDPRFWQGGENITVDFSASLPSDVNEREYDVLLNLPDPAPSLHDRPEYSIHLTNQNLWEAKTDYNILYKGLDVSKK
jgi:hypothetical protein